MTYRTKPLIGYRFVSIAHGDTLQSIAQRELGDYNLWRELIAINDLAPPYITGDPLEAGQRVRLYGQELIIPAPNVQAGVVTDPERIFGVDISLTGGRLEAANGDLAVIGGEGNLRQAIKHRVATPLKELKAHPTYGCGIHSLKGEGGDPTSSALAAKYLEGALEADPRITAVDDATATIVGDAVEVSATALAVSGTSLDILTAV